MLESGTWCLNVQDLPLLASVSRAVGNCFGDVLKKSDYVGYDSTIFLTIRFLSNTLVLICIDFASSSLTNCGLVKWTNLLSSS